MKSIFIALVVLIFFLGITPNYGCGQIEKKIIKVEKKGKQGYLGVEVRDVTKKIKEKKNLSVDRGAYVQSVVEDSPAEEAGILKGDVIVKFGDEGVDDGEELTDAVRATKPKTKVKVEINRKGEKKNIEVVVGKVKTPEALAFSYGFDEPNWIVKKKIPKLSERFNVRIFTESEIYGLQLHPLTKQLGKYFGSPDGKGILISEVEEGSGAEKAGFKAGDVIIKINDQPVRKMDDLREELSEYEGKEVPFEIIRNGKAMKLSMKIENENEDQDEEDEDDDWSGIIAPDKHLMNMYELDMLPQRLELDCLRDRLLDLRQDIEQNARIIKKTIDCKFMES